MTRCDCRGARRAAEVASFLNRTPSLAGSRWSPDNLKRAQVVWRDLLEQFAPEWLKEPQGELRKYWLSDGLAPVEYLIDLAWTLDHTYGAITQKSTPVFISKFRQLIVSLGEEFDNLLTELQVAALVGVRISPIAFEPFVPLQFDEAKKPVSADFGVRVPGGDVVIEVTVARPSFLANWSSQSQEFTNALSRWASNIRLMVAATARLPIDFRASNVKRSDYFLLAERMKNSPGGVDQPIVAGCEGRIDWRPMTFVSPDGLNVSVPPPHVLVRHAFSIGVSILPVEDIESRLLSSLQRLLDRKRSQSVEGMAIVIALRLGDARLIGDAYARLFFQRVWPNPRYNWLAGVLLYIRNAGAPKDQSIHRIDFGANPNALWPVPKAFNEVFEANAQFHLHRKKDLSQPQADSARPSVS
jgi:hypothetical protein